ncbi:hypothetical protein Leryth_004776 [Lithospermum erythrorhizon]|nr:hypothetical protein Leryth_004776 [Lithospermum erythrorhizon]
MQISGNRPPQLLQRFQSTVLPHPGSPNVDSGSNHPEAFQRLLEMERKEKSKQIHPPPPGHSQAMYKQ